MDRLAHAVALAAAGSSPEATAIEVSLGGLSIESQRGVGAAPVDVAVAGGDFRVRLDGARLDPWVVVTLRPGQRLDVVAGPAGSWAYVAVAGDIETPSWLGHTATHSMSGLGGGLVSTGDEFVVSSPRCEPARSGQIPVPTFATGANTARVVLGPQDHRFAVTAVDTFLNTEWRVTDAFDRMGARLAGPTLALASPEALSIPSEPVVRGSVQVAGDGAPTILHADHQTTGGYPKIATIISADLDRVAQSRSGEELRFEAVTPPEAIDITRAWRLDVERLVRRMASPGRTLSQRLMIENLVHGADVSDTTDPEA